MPATSTAAVPAFQVIDLGKHQQPIFIDVKINSLLQWTCVFYTVQEYQFLSPAA